jgi:hypothetical protein
MTFFPDVALVVTWTRIEDGVWTGQVEGSGAGPATMTLSGSMVTANISIADGLIYQIRTTDDGQVWVREVDSNQFPEESEPIRQP